MVSEEFKQAIKQPARELSSKITFPGLTIDDGNISTIDLDSSLVFGEDFEIGTAPMDTMKVELIVDEGEWGRNLLRNGDEEKSRTGQNAHFGFPFSAEELEVGISLTVSFDAKSNEDNFLMDYYFRSPSNVVGSIQPAFRVDTEYKRYVVKMNTPNDISEKDSITTMHFRPREDGTLYIKNVKIEKGNKATDWTPAPEDILDYNYENKELNAKLGIRLPDNTVEYQSIGKYTVEKAVKKNNKITLDCVDGMYKAEKDFENNLMFPATIYEILSSACEQSDITLATTTFANSNYVVPNEPVFENITCRKIFSQVAELAGGYAKINRDGDLEIITLGNTVVREITKDHYFELKQDEVSIGRIDKVIVKVGEEESTQGTGENIYNIVDNMFVQDPNNVVGPIFNVLKDVNYASCDFSWQGDFSLDLGDKITIDDNETYILDRKLKYTGGLREDYKAPAKSNIERNSTGKSNILLDMNNIKTQIKVIEGEITQSIEKIENLVIDASNRLYQSQTEIPFVLNVGTGSMQLFRDSFHPYYKVTSDTNINLSASFPNSQFAENLAGEEVTISIDVLVDVDRTVTIDNKEHEVKGNRWTRIWVTKTLPINTTENVRVKNPYSRKLSRDKVHGTNLIDSLSTDINILYYRNLQVQKGNLPSNWTLTPEELEANINRYNTQIKQLIDSIALIATRNENTGRLEVTPESIVMAIDTTDGVGRLKTVNVTINENGLTIEEGALIIRDSNNAAIITSDGIKVSHMYTSSGQLSGFQRIGIWDNYDHIGRPEATFNVTIPDNIVITKAELIVKSMPSYLRGWSNIPDGFYHARNLRIVISEDALDGFLDYPFGGSEGVIFMGAENPVTDITNQTWGASWTPTGRGIKERSANVMSYVRAGEETTFIVATTDMPNQANSRYMGGLQFILLVEGFLRG